jgi:hypothetical protein
MLADESPIPTLHHHIPQLRTRNAMPDKGVPEPRIAVRPLCSEYKMKSPLQHPEIAPFEHPHYKF